MKEDVDMSETAVVRGAKTLMADLLAGKIPLIPVLHIENVEHAEPTLFALEEAGIAAIEVTLRTTAAIKVIERMKRLATSANIGAGTITRPEQFKRVRDAGAVFAVSPALTVAFAEAAERSGLAYMPGVATPTEALRARELGFQELKFFPADLFGGVGFLRHLSPLNPELKFCPTGGVSNENIRSFLTVDNVFAAGGVYLAPRALIEAGRWEDLTAVARTAIRHAADT
jgi:2-dehydro-3-deoxyphosphogluconate aldolase/(4S)-4-hydroxy-2-oxoglutarate aldolase